MPRTGPPHGKPLFSRDRWPTRCSAREFDRLRGRVLSIPLAPTANQTLSTVFTVGASSALTPPRQPTSLSPCHPVWMRVIVMGLIVALSLFEPPPALWDWPVTGPHRILRDFDAPRSPWGPGHRGIDIELASGKALLAPVSGRLRFQGEVVDRGVVTIETSDGYLVSMEPVSVVLPKGSRVRQGQIIGEVASGHCRVRCLHLGLRIDGEYRSPAAFLGYERRALLVPWPTD